VKIKEDRYGLAV